MWTAGWNGMMSNQPEPISIVLRRLPLLARLTPAQLEMVAAAFLQMRLNPGQRLHRQNEPSPGLFFFISGSAQALRRDPDGVERSVGDIRAGQSYGEPALLLSEPQPVSVLVVQNSDVLLLTRERFNALLDAHPEITPLLAFAPELSQRLTVNRQQGLTATEHTLLRTRRHWWKFGGQIARSGLVALLLLITGLVLWQTNTLAPFVPLLLFGAAFTLLGVFSLYFVVEWANDWFTITDQRIIHDERSLIRLTEQREQALFHNIQNINVRRSGIVAELLNFGNVVVGTAGTQKPVILDMIPLPYRAQELIFDQMKRRGLTPTTDPISNGDPFNTTRPEANPLIGILRVLFPRFRTVDGDRLIYRRHWSVLLRNMWQPTLLLVILLSVWLSGRLGFLNAVPRPVVFLGVVIWLAINTFWWYWQYIDWRDDLFIIDTQYVTDLKRRPLWLQEVKIQAGLAQIQNVTSRVAGLFQRIFNVGDVVVQTASEQGRLVFEDVGNPARISEELLQRVQRFNEARAEAAKQQQRQMIDDYLGRRQ
jgi:hypothetical protein